MPNAQLRTWLRNDVTAHKQSKNRFASGTIQIHEYQTFKVQQPQQKAAVLSRQHPNPVLANSHRQHLLP